MTLLTEALLIEHHGGMWIEDGGTGGDRRAGRSSTCARSGVHSRERRQNIPLARVKRGMTKKHETRE